MNEMNDMKKLGRRAVVTDSRTLKLSKYFSATLPPPPPARDWTRSEKTWGEMLNDKYGCCTIAGLGHAGQVWTANASREVSISDDLILWGYENWCGFNPTDPSTDQGGICLNVLKDFKAQGLGPLSLTAFASVLPANKLHVQQAINLFTGLYIGMDIPAYIMPENRPVPTIWEMNLKADNTSLGGHCVYVTGYDEKFVNFISWGQNYKLTWAFWAAKVDEAYALISKDQIESVGVSPLGFSLEDLETDLVNIS